MLRGISFLLAMVLLVNNSILSHAAEVNFWKDRSKTIQLASLPASFNSPMPASVVKPAVLPARIKKLIGPHAPSTLIDILSALPANAGTVRDVALPKNISTMGFVVHIQDVHMNLEAQKNIGTAVQALIEQQKVKVVALEGAFEPLDVQELRQDPDAGINRKVADYLLKENQISGPIYGALTLPSHSELPFIGVDDPTAYESNVKAVRESSGLKEKAKAEWKKSFESLSVHKKAVFNPALLKFDAQMTAYHQGSMEMGAYVKALASFHDDMSLPISTFLEALELEKSLNFSQVEHERVLALDKLLAKMNPEETSALVNQSALFKTGQINHADFYQYLKDLCDRHQIPLNRFTALSDYLQYVLLSDSIDGEQLLSDVRGLENTVAASLAVSPEEKELVKQSRQLLLTQKLLDFSLTKEEWSEFKGVLSASSLVPSKDLKPFRDFYEKAEVRDNAMAVNLLGTKHQALGTVILVTGGFHAVGIKKELLARGVGVISFVPRITRLRPKDDYGGQAPRSLGEGGYLSIFTQEKTPLEKLFEGEKLFLANLPILPTAPNAATTLGVAERARQGLPQIRKIKAEIKKISEQVIQIIWPTQTIEVHFRSDQAIDSIVLSQNRQKLEWIKEQWINAMGWLDQFGVDVLKWLDGLFPPFFPGLALPDGGVLSSSLFMSGDLDDSSEEPELEEEPESEPEAKKSSGPRAKVISRLPTSEPPSGKSPELQRQWKIVVEGLQNLIISPGSQLYISPYVIREDWNDEVSLKLSTDELKAILEEMGFLPTVTHADVYFIPRVKSGANLGVKKRNIMSRSLKRELPHILQLAQEKFDRSSANTIDNNRYWSDASRSVDQKRIDDKALNQVIADFFRKMPTENPVVFDAGKDPSPAGKCDGVLAIDILERLSPIDQLESLEKLKGAMKEAGVLLVHWKHGPNRVKLEEMISDKSGDVITGWTFPVTSEYLKILLETAGFELVHKVLDVRYKAARYWVAFARPIKTEPSASLTLPSSIRIGRWILTRIFGPDNFHEPEIVRFSQLWVSWWAEILPMGYRFWESSLLPWFVFFHNNKGEDGQFSWKLFGIRLSFHFLIVYSLTFLPLLSPSVFSDETLYRDILLLHMGGHLISNFLDPRVMRGVETIVNRRKLSGYLYKFEQALSANDSEAIRELYFEIEDDGLSGMGRSYISSMRSRFGIGLSEEDPSKPIIISERSILVLIAIFIIEKDPARFSSRQYGRLEKLIQRLINEGRIEGYHSLPSLFSLALSPNNRNEFLWKIFSSRIARIPGKAGRKAREFRAMLISLHLFYNFIDQDMIDIETAIPSFRQVFENVGREISDWAVVFSLLFLAAESNDVGSVVNEPIKAREFWFGRSLLNAEEVRVRNKFLSTFAKRKGNTWVVNREIIDALQRARIELKDREEENKKSFPFILEWATYLWEVHRKISEIFWRSGKKGLLRPLDEILSQPLDHLELTSEFPFTMKSNDMLRYLDRLIRYLEDGAPVVERIQEKGPVRPEPIPVALQTSGFWTWIPGVTEEMAVKGISWWAEALLILGVYSWLVVGQQWSPLWATAASLALYCAIHINRVEKNGKGYATRWILKNSNGTRSPPRRYLLSPIFFFLAGLILFAPAFVVVSYRSSFPDPLLHVLLILAVLWSFVIHIKANQSPVYDPILNSYKKIWSKGLETVLLLWKEQLLSVHFDQYLIFLRAIREQDEAYMRSGMHFKPEMEFVRYLQKRLKDDLGVKQLIGQLEVWLNMGELDEAGTAQDRLLFDQLSAHFSEFDLAAQKFLDSMNRFGKKPKFRFLDLLKEEYRYFFIPFIPYIVLSLATGPDIVLSLATGPVTYLGLFLAACGIINPKRLSLFHADHRQYLRWMDKFYRDGYKAYLKSRFITLGLIRFFIIIGFAFIFTGMLDVIPYWFAGFLAVFIGQSIGFFYHLYVVVWDRYLGIYPATGKYVNTLYFPFTLFFDTRPGVVTYLNRKPKKINAIGIPGVRIFKQNTDYETYATWHDGTQYINVGEGAMVIAQENPNVPLELLSISFSTCLSMAIKAKQRVNGQLVDVVGLAHLYSWQMQAGIEQVAFDQWLKWLDTLANDYQDVQIALNMTDRQFGLNNSRTLLGAARIRGIHVVDVVQRPTNDAKTTIVMDVTVNNKSVEYYHFADGVVEPLRPIRWEASHRKRSGNDSLPWGEWAGSNLAVNANGFLEFDSFKKVLTSLFTSPSVDEDVDALLFHLRTLKLPREWEPMDYWIAYFAARTFDQEKLRRNFEILARQENPFDLLLYSCLRHVQHIKFNGPHGEDRNIGQAHIYIDHEILDLLIHHLLDWYFNRAIPYESFPHYKSNHFDPVSREDLLFWIMDAMFHPENHPPTAEHHRDYAPEENEYWLDFISRLAERYDPVKLDNLLAKVRAINWEKDFGLVAPAEYESPVLDTNNAHDPENSRFLVPFLAFMDPAIVSKEAALYKDAHAEYLDYAVGLFAGYTKGRIREVYVRDRLEAVISALKLRIDLSNHPWRSWFQSVAVDARLMAIPSLRELADEAIKLNPELKPASFGFLLTGNPVIGWISFALESALMLGAFIGGPWLGLAAITIIYGLHWLFKAWRAGPWIQHLPLVSYAFLVIPAMFDHQLLFFATASAIVLVHFLWDYTYIDYLPQTREPQVQLAANRSAEMHDLLFMICEDMQFFFVSFIPFMALSFIPLFFNGEELRLVGLGLNILVYLIGAAIAYRDFFHTPEMVRDFVHGHRVWIQQTTKEEQRGYLEYLPKKFSNFGLFRFVATFSLSPLLYFFIVDAGWQAAWLAVAFGQLAGFLYHIYVFKYEAYLDKYPATGRYEITSPMEEISERVPSLMAENKEYFDEGLDAVKKLLEEKGIGWYSIRMVWRVLRENRDPTSINANEIHRVLLREEFLSAYAAHIQGNKYALVYLPQLRKKLPAFSDSEFDRTVSELVSDGYFRNDPDENHLTTDFRKLVGDVVHGLGFSPSGRKFKDLEKGSLRKIWEEERGGGHFRDGMETYFFRDDSIPDDKTTYEIAESEIRKELQNETPAAKHPFRIVVVGSAFGMQGYTIACAAAEALRLLQYTRPIEVVITDLYDASLDEGRQGLFHNSLFADMARMSNFDRERYQKYFIDQGKEHKRIFTVKEFREKYGVQVRYERLNVMSQTDAARLTSSGSFDVVVARNVHYQELDENDPTIDLRDEEAIYYENLTDLVKPLGTAIVDFNYSTRHHVSVIRNYAHFLRTYITGENRGSIVKDKQTFFMVEFLSAWEPSRVLRTIQNNMNGRSLGFEFDHDFLATILFSIMRYWVHPEARLILVELALKNWTQAQLGSARWFGREPGIRRVREAVSKGPSALFGLDWDTYTPETQEKIEAFFLEHGERLYGAMGEVAAPDSLLFLFVQSKWPALAAKHQGKLIVAGWAIEASIIVGSFVYAWWTGLIAVSIIYGLHWLFKEWRAGPWMQHAVLLVYLLIAIPSYFDLPRIPLLLISTVIILFHLEWDLGFVSKLVAHFSIPTSSARRGFIGESVVSLGMGMNRDKMPLIKMTDAEREVLRNYLNMLVEWPSHNFWSDPSNGRTAKELRGLRQAYGELKQAGRISEESAASIERAEKGFLEKIEESEAIAPEFFRMTLDVFDARMAGMDVSQEDFDLWQCMVRIPRSIRAEKPLGLSEGEFIQVFQSAKSANIQPDGVLDFILENHVYPSLLKRCDHLKPLATRMGVELTENIVRQEARQLLHRAADGKEIDFFQEKSDDERIIYGILETQARSHWSQLKQRIIRDLQIMYPNAEVPFLDDDYNRNWLSSDRDSMMKLEQGLRSKVMRAAAESELLHRISEERPGTMDIPDSRDLYRLSIEDINRFIGNPAAYIEQRTAERAIVDKRETPVRPRLEEKVNRESPAIRRAFEKLLKILEAAARLHSVELVIQLGDKGNVRLIGWEDGRIRHTLTIKEQEPFEYVWPIKWRENYPNQTYRFHIQAGVKADQIKALLFDSAWLSKAQDTKSDVHIQLNRRLALPAPQSEADPAQAATMFEPGATSKPGHLGMGLFIVQSIIVAAGGTIRAESIPGTGTTFHIELPAVETDDSVRSIEENLRSQPADLGVGKATVKFVEGTDGKTHLEFKIKNRVLSVVADDGNGLIHLQGLLLQNNISDLKVLVDSKLRTRLEDSPLASYLQDLQDRQGQPDQPMRVRSYLTKWGISLWLQIPLRDLLKKVELDWKVYKQALINA